MVNKKHAYPVPNVFESVLFPILHRESQVLGSYRIALSFKHKAIPSSEPLILIAHGCVYEINSEHIGQDGNKGSLKSTADIAVFH